jgi:hypothetical protein
MSFYLSTNTSISHSNEEKTSNASQHLITTPVAVVTATATVVPLEYVTFNNAGFSSTATLAAGTVNIGSAGNHVVDVHAEWEFNATGLRTLEVLVNGVASRTLVETADGANTHHQDVSLVLVLSPGDLISVRYTQTSGIALNLNLAEVNVRKL